MLREYFPLVESSIESCLKSITLKTRRMHIKNYHLHVKPATGYYKASQGTLIPVRKQQTRPLKGCYHKQSSACALLVHRKQRWQIALTLSCNLSHVVVWVVSSYYYDDIYFHFKNTHCMVVTESFQLELVVNATNQTCAWGDIVPSCCYPWAMTSYLVRIFVGIDTQTYL